MAVSVLDTFYAEEMCRARRLVASRYPLDVCDAATPEYPPGVEGWREVWHVTAGCASAPLPLIVAIPYSFPDSLPSVFLERADADRAPWIPHLNSDGLLCTFDVEEVVPNLDTHPGKIVIAVVERAVAVWQAGISGANQDDFSDEFEAYWALHAENRVLSLVQPLERPQTVLAWHLLPNWKEHTWLVAQTKAEGQRWLENIGYRSAGETTPVLYLPVANLGSPPFPATNQEIYRQLKQHDPVALDRLLAFLGQHRRPAGVLSSVLAGSDRALGMWWHPAFAHEVYRGGPRSHRHPGAIPGFRPGSRSARIELIGRHGDAPLVRGAVTRVDEGRLRRRTAGTQLSTAPQAVNLVGCGAIGSLLAESLARTGAVSRFRLIDPDILTAENVLRHLCGMTEIDQPKVEAVSRRLANHFPHIAVESHAQDMLDVIRTIPHVLAPAALTVVAVGAYALERRINRLSLTGAAPGMDLVCYVWVEPYLLGGHAVLVRADQPGCLECLFDDQFLFRHRVIADPSDMMRRESGCQTTYMPYSGVDALQFIAALTRFIVSAAAAPENTVFSWVGDLQEAQRMSIDIQPQWEATPSFTARQYPFLASSCCPLCAPL